MSHELEEVNGKIEMAYLVDDGAPWHGLGQGIPLEMADNLDFWGEQSNMSQFYFDMAPVLFYSEDTDSVERFDNRYVAFRSDNKRPMDVVSGGYKFVQPKETLDFFSRVIGKMGYRMTSCGVLQGGQRFWAQAMTGQDYTIGGEDRIRDGILLATGFRGATIGMRTVVRVVCQNTYTQAMRGGNKVKVSHSTTFNPDEMATELGLEESVFGDWATIAESMSQVKIADNTALDYFGRVFELYEGQEDLSLKDRLEITYNNKTVTGVYDLFVGGGLGSQFKSANGTLWGAVNAVSEYVDHRRNTKTFDARMDSAWFGPGKAIKERAWDEAILMAG